MVRRKDYYGDRMRKAVASEDGPPRFALQEGFLDELLFGQDWWTVEVALLNAALPHHPGLRFAKSFEKLPVFIKCVDPAKRFF